MHTYRFSFRYDGGRKSTITTIEAESEIAALEKLRMEYPDAKVTNTIKIK